MLGIQASVTAGERGAVFSNGSGLTSTQVGYGDSANRVKGDSAFTRGTLTFSVDANTDNTFTTGYGMMGLIPSGTTTNFYIAQASNYAAGNWALTQTSAGATFLNCKTGAGLNLTVNGSNKVVINAASAVFQSGVPVTISDATASSSSATGALIIAGGVGVAANVIGAARFMMSGAQTTFLSNSQNVAVYRSGATITPSVGDMVFQSDSNVGPRGFYYVAGATTGAIVASILPSAVAGTSPSFTTVGTSTITGGVTDGYNASIRLTPTYDAATALTVTRHNYIDVNDTALTGAGPAACTDAAIFRFNAAPGTHDALAANGAVVTVISGVGPTGAQTTIQGWMKINVNGTLRYVPFW